MLWYLVYGIFLTFNRQILAWCARRYNHFRNIDDMELETLLVDGDGKGSEIDDDEEEDTPFWRVYKYIIMPYILLFRFTLPDVSEKSPYDRTSHTHISCTHRVSPADKSSFLGAG